MNQRLRELMSGEMRGPLASGLRGLLAACEVGYRAAVSIRTRRFYRGIDVHYAGVPVISVGNITVGGTGKTPVVAKIAEHIRGRSVRVALLSRGYRAGSAGPDGQHAGNDEARVLARLCPGVPHRQQADRVAGAAAAISDWNAELLLLDDGFQHRRLVRDLDIVLVDATCPFGYGRLLPRGLLREPVSALGRAHLIILTRADALDADGVERLREEVRAIAPRAPIVEATFPAVRLVNSSGRSLPLEGLAETPLLAFCGIGNPDGFAKTLSQAGLGAEELIAFPDHHDYSKTSLEQLARRAEAQGASAVVTTLKDLVKLPVDLLPGEIPLWAVETGCEFTANQAALWENVDRLVAAAMRRSAA